MPKKSLTPVVNNRTEQFTNDVIQYWLQNEEVTICPDSYGLKNFCGSQNCTLCKIMALQDAEIQCKVIDPPN